MGLKLFSFLQCLVTAHRAVDSRNWAGQVTCVRCGCRWKPSNPQLYAPPPEVFGGARQALKTQPVEIPGAVLQPILDTVPQAVEDALAMKRRAARVTAWRGISDVEDTSRTTTDDDSSATRH